MKFEEFLLFNGQKFSWMKSYFRYIHSNNYSKSIYVEKGEKKKNLASLSNNFKIMQKVNTCVAYWHLIGSWINPNGTIEISSFNIFVCAIAYSNRSDTVLGHVKLCEPQGAAGSVESFILMDWILLSNTQFYSSNLIIEYCIYILILKTLYEMNQSYVHN